ncbi:precorrin-2 dehydrogenase/sirohydrochlorin ferrochelatase family protein [Tuwongella immobilis]|uniref:precorrin-2 dehydrogenase n=1 Tax=Tuwongella immobilis TaxID=692036 RepID=A0A6C2YUC3_9BACT|nr:bifunctional precorrin-2 dehydrogenase/sirohydrochlorin ferrochelatase [Tuwongella immobilis]VIP05034.1 siroheme synthase : Siroheme synthase OS=Desulfotomaculum carboxydivorans (strain DSM 14880 / VKM B-2319 / CO-1-SRB) GN=Desca_1546 PE=4 SV=1: NAD_binding_7 [Tuwongella immobilis]VTS07424.1 siroheme synthase : Siroheme synthase OS=Desulfotomaculum carboxydivorans (strain DSM 14880 / VKM B-2319 / CO-1-SRB) GN=Desca_1546 PE=4 SV=1: NAD_binding_7 [Tuwongella immobilis]
MAVHYPILLCRTDLRAVVIGGGPVGQRKAAGLRDAGIPFRLVSLTPAPEDWSDSPQSQWVQDAYRPDHLDASQLVFAAAVPTVNAQVLADAHARGLWVNSADNPEAGDFVLPAVIRQGDLLLAVHTGGAAPSLAKRIRERLSQDFDSQFGEWVALLAEVRPQILARIPDSAARRGLLQSITEWHWLDRFRQEGRDSVAQSIEESIRRLEASGPTSL